MATKDRSRIKEEIELFNIVWLQKSLALKTVRLIRLSGPIGQRERERERERDLKNRKLLILEKIFLWPESWPGKFRPLKLKSGESPLETF